MSAIGFSLVDAHEEDASSRGAAASKTKENILNNEEDAHELAALALKVDTLGERHGSLCSNGVAASNLTCSAESPY